MKSRFINWAPVWNDEVMCQTSSNIDAKILVYYDWSALNISPNCQIAYEIFLFLRYSTEIISSSGGQWWNHVSFISKSAANITTNSQIVVDISPFYDRTEVKWWSHFSLTVPCRHKDSGLLQLNSSGYWSELSNRFWYSYS